MLAAAIQYPLLPRPEWTSQDEDYYDLLMATPVPVSSSVWRCRICAFERYHRVSVMRKNGSRYETQHLTRSDIQNAALDRNHHGMGAVGGIELWQDAFHVCLDGSLGDVELGADHFIGLACRHST